MYPTYAAVVQVIPKESHPADPESCRLAVREAVETWVQESTGAEVIDNPQAAAGELRTVPLTGSLGEIREVEALGELPWVWQVRLTRDLPCATYPELVRSLVTQVQMRAAGADDIDAPPVRESGFKLVITMREHLAFAEGERSPGTAAEIAPPCSLIEHLVDGFRVFQGRIEWTKSYWRVHDHSSVDELFRQISDPTRAVPLVVTVGTRETEPPIPPRDLGSRLFAIGRVAHIEKPYLTGRLRERLGDLHRVGWGTIRVFRSHYRGYDAPPTHPFFLSRDIEAWRHGDFLDYLADRVQRGETPLVDDDPVVVETFRRVAERSARETRQAIDRALDVLTETVGESTVEDLAAHIETLKSLNEEEREARLAAEKDRTELNLQLEELRKESYSLRSRIHVLEADRAAPSQRALPDTSDFPEPATLVEAIDQALTLVDDEIVIPEDVRKSVHRVQGIYPRVLRDKLHAMTQVVRSCRAGVGDGRSPGDYFGDYGIELKTDISDTARNRFRADYLVRYTDSLGDHEEVMGPHIDLSERHRIYWFHDKANQRFVIGHIGDHLRDKSTK